MAPIQYTSLAATLVQKITDGIKIVVKANSFALPGYILLKITNIFQHPK